jgi:hypothetical protein
MSVADPYPQPPRTHRADGEERRVGVEFEFGGLRPEAILAAITGAIGGTPERLSSVQWYLHDTRVGRLRIELDFALMQRVAAEQESVDLPDWLLELTEWTADVAERIASRIVPWEVVTGPIPLSDLHHLESLIAGLRDAGALGTRNAPHFAFGVHLNPELPALDADTVTAYLKAYLCLNDWLRMRARVDLARWITPYVDDFDADWVRGVVQPDYRPALPSLIDDYLRHNPTRNRSLDMLPLFMELDADRVRAALDDPLIKARPTLHYRLPNCEIDDPDWTLRSIWSDWLEVERLAADPSRLARMGVAYAEWLDGFHLPFDEGWARASADWLA